MNGKSFTSFERISMSVHIQYQNIVQINKCSRIFPLIWTSIANHMILLVICFTEDFKIVLLLFKSNCGEFKFKRIEFGLSTERVTSTQRAVIADKTNVCSIAKGKLSICT